jgi:hypothetical protein
LQRRDCCWIGVLATGCSAGVSNILVYRPWSTPEFRARCKAAPTARDFLVVWQHVEPADPRMELVASSWSPGPPLGPLSSSSSVTNVMANRLPVRCRAIRSIGSRSF